MELTVITPEEEYYHGKVDSVKVPGTSGEFQILRNHAAIVSSLQEGKVTFREKDGNEKVIMITGGFVEVFHNKVSLLINSMKQ